MSATCCPSPDVRRHGGDGRPKILSSDEEKTSFYSRPSSWGGVLQNTFYLDLWKQRRVAIGLSMKPELLLSVTAHRDDTDPANKRKLNDLCEKAKTAAGGGDRAELGTALHKLAENHDLAGSGDYATYGAYGDDIDAYIEATEGMDHEHIEHFLVCDELQAAGTADRLSRIDGKLRVVDIKTGNNDVRYPDKAAIQMAIYAHSDLYDVDSGKRTEADIEKDWGVLIELPAGTGECRLWKIDLEKGWRGALLAQEVRSWRTESNFLEGF